MKPESAAPGAPTSAVSESRPWAGVIFSLLIPGFGIARGGCWGRAAAWFLGLEVGLVVVGLGLALEEMPFGVGVAAAACWVFAVLAMLYQSYRPGRMTGKHWAAFIGLCALSLIAGSPVRLVVRAFRLPTGSMNPTLQGSSDHGDHILVDRLTYRFASPRRGDLLVFRTEGILGLPQDQIYIKRIVGMPGEHLEIHDGAVFADGTRLTQGERIPPIRFTPGELVAHGETASRASYQVAPGSYFVVGDNQDNSLDSRHFGCVPSPNVYGKVTAIYYPFSRAGRPRYPGEPVGAASRSQPSRVETNSTAGAAGPRR